MRILLFILLVPFLLLLAIPLGGVLLGIGGAIFGVIIGVLGAIFGIIAAIFATIFGGLFTIGGLSTGLFFGKIILITIIVLVIYSLFRRNPASNKVTKQ